MKFLLLIFFFCWTLNALKAQQFDKRLLDEKVKLIDTAFRFKQTTYIINGIPFFEADSIKIDSALQANGLKYLISIGTLDKTTRNLIHNDNDIVLVAFAYRQKTKRKRELFKKVKQSFEDAKGPVLYIDNILIHYTEAKRKIKALTLKSIYYIDYNSKPVSAESYGENAKNGLVKIWTVPK